MQEAEGGEGRAKPGRGLPVRTRRIVWGGLAVVAVAAVALALRPSAVQVDTGDVSRGVLRVVVEEDGRTRVRNRYVVAAPLAGTLARIELRPGDDVVEGTEVARITPLPAPLLDPRSRAEAEGRLSSARATLEGARAEEGRASAALDAARRETERQRILLREGSGFAFAVEQAEAAEEARAREMDGARSRIRVAEQEVETARAALSRVTGGGGEVLPVRAPVGGRVLRVHQESEGAVQPGAALLELGDPSDLEVVVDLLTMDAVRVQPGAPVTLERWGGDPLQARVVRVEPSAFTRLSALGVEEQRVNVVAELDERAATMLGDGFRVEARILVEETGEVTRVPSSAVFRSGDGWAVFRVLGGRARLTAVEVGVRTAEAVEVVRGVEPGERVVIYPGDQVADGVRVRER